MGALCFPQNLPQFEVHFSVRSCESVKRKLTLIFAVALALSLACPAFAAGSGTTLYPENIVEYTEGDHPRLNKVYILTAADDPALIPTADFERDGKTYTLLDVTRQDNGQTDAKDYAETVTLSSKTKDKEKIIAKLEPSMEAATEDGYTGTLTLDTASIKVEAAGYGSFSRTVTATRSYPNLSDADASLVPKTIEDNGRTLTLADIQWQEAGGYYHATANYTGTTTSRYATGYTVTATYSGEVTKINNDTVIYTAIFGVTSVEGTEDPAGEPVTPIASMKWLPVIPVVICLAGLAALGLYLSKKHKAKKSWEGYGK